MKNGAARKQILVVDDDEAIALLVERALASDFDVRSTTSAAVALGWLASGQSFDAVVFDLRMPTMSGVAFHAALVGQYPNLARRGVVLTGGAQDAEARGFMATTTLEHVSKPFRFANLHRAVAAVLAR